MHLEYSGCAREVRGSILVTFEFSSGCLDSVCEVVQDVKKISLHTYSFCLILRYSLLRVDAIAFVLNIFCRKQINGEGLLLILYVAQLYPGTRHGILQAYHVRLLKRSVYPKLKA